jgi:hypothetical protein
VFWECSFTWSTYHLFCFLMGVPNLLHLL